MKSKSSTEATFHGIPLNNSAIYTIAQLQISAALGSYSYLWNCSGAMYGLEPLIPTDFLMVSGVYGELKNISDEPKSMIFNCETFFIKIFSGYILIMIIIII